MLLGMKRPVASSQATIEALLERSKRPTSEVPIRRTFVQQGTRKAPGPGPLADFVRRHDDRALDLYLLLRAVASGGDWEVGESSLIWARCLDLGSADTARSAISKTWRRLEDMNLVTRTRSRRRAIVTPLREDGSGKRYTHPGAGKRRQPYMKLPFAYWTAPESWHRQFDLPTKAMLLIALSLEDNFILPYDRAKAWYGISADTAERGLRALRRAELLSARSQYEEAPLSPLGYTERLYYTLRPPFGPKSKATKKRTRGRSK